MHLLPGGWLTPVIPVTQEAEIKRMEVQAQPGKKLVRPYLSKQARCNPSYEQVSR
jgi:hypothetical protein